jgi:hypothetical protein
MQFPARYLGVRPKRFHGFVPAIDVLVPGVRLAAIRPVYGSREKQLRISWTNRAGCSNAAKCPPRSSLFQ